jgi:hypothetical protein
MVNRTRREEERTWPPISRRPPCLRHSGSSRLFHRHQRENPGFPFFSVEGSGNFYSVRLLLAAQGGTEGR